MKIISEKSIYITITPMNVFTWSRKHSPVEIDMDSDILYNSHFFCIKHFILMPIRCKKNSTKINLGEMCFLGQNPKWPSS